MFFPDQFGRAGACRALFAAAALLASSTMVAGSAHAENRLALVIGQSAYRAVVPLPNTVNDARKMSELLGAAGFEVTTAGDLTQTEMREAISDFTAKVAAKGPDTVALVFYGGHGMQVDGENFLIPVELNPKRDSDVSLQAVRLNDLLNTLGSVPSKMRIVMIDACRNNPFPEVNKTAGRGLALVDAKAGSTGSFLTYSTSPGSEAEDGSGSNSPYTTALLTAAREPGVPIEETFKRVRISVSKETSGRQIPWESSSLTETFIFFPGGTATATRPLARDDASRSVESWSGELRGMQPQAAYETVVAANTAEAYEAFVKLFGQSTLGASVRVLLVRRYEMLAWNMTVTMNTAAGFRAFLASYPNSDLAPTARRLEERLRNRPVFANAVATGGSVAAGSAPAASGAPPQAQPANASLAPTCPCATPAPPTRKKAETPPAKKRADDRPRRRPAPDDDVIVYQRPVGPGPLIYGRPGGPIGGGGGIRVPSGGGYGREPAGQGGSRGQGRY